MWKDFFFFSKGERNGLIILASLIILMFAVNFCLPAQNTIPQEITGSKTSMDSIAGSITKTYAQRDDTAVGQDTSKRETYGERYLSKNEYHHTEGKSNKKYRRKLSYTPKTEEVNNYENLSVEINSADTTELKKLRGIGSVLSKRIVKYRKKLGGFKEIGELKNVYGLSEETYQQILPHIWIDTSAITTSGMGTSKRKKREGNPHQNRMDSLPHH